MNVFEAGVKISLIDLVSSRLGVISQHLTKTALASDALNAKLAGIGASFSRAGMYGAGAAVLAMPLILATKEAEKYQHQLNQMTSAGMNHKEMVDSIAASWKTTGDVITSSAIGNLKIISDLRTITGESSSAITLMT